MKNTPIKPHPKSEFGCGMINYHAGCPTGKISQTEVKVVVSKYTVDAMYMIGEMKVLQNGEEIPCLCGCDGASMNNDRIK